MHLGCHAEIQQHETSVAFRLAGTFCVNLVFTPHSPGTVEASVLAGLAAPGDTTPVVAAATWRIKSKLALMCKRKV